MTEWKYDSEEKIGTLSVVGDMTINQVAGIKERLVKAFNDAEQVMVDLSATTSIDVAGVQLLCACHRFSCQYGKKMRLDLGDNDIVSAFLDEVGFSRSFVCDKGDDDCLWNASH